MTEIIIRDLPDYVVEALRARAKRRGVSLEEEVGAILTASIDTARAAFASRAAALRALSAGRPMSAELDSVKIIRKARDAWG